MSQQTAIGYKEYEAGLDLEISQKEVCHLCILDDLLG
jgi:hypothetical protein